VRAQRVPVTERTLVRRSYDCFNRRDPEGAFPLYTEDCRWSFRHFSGWPDEQRSALIGSGICESPLEQLPHDAKDEVRFKF